MKNQKRLPPRQQTANLERPVPTWIHRNTRQSVTSTYNASSGLQEGWGTPQVPHKKQQPRTHQSAEVGTGYMVPEDGTGPPVHRLELQRAAYFSSEAKKIR